MKKLLSLILVALMVIPFGALAATGISADEGTVLYVKEGATGDGSSADNALPTLYAANTKAAATAGDVTIKFVGTVTVDTTDTSVFTEGFKSNSSLIGLYYTEDAHTNTITWTKHDDTSKLVFKTHDSVAGYYNMGGALNIKDLAIEIQGNKVLAIVTSLYDIVVDTGVTIANQNPDKAIETAIIMGINGQEGLGVNIGLHNQFYDAARNCDVANPNITVKSGSFKQVIGYMANYNITPVTMGSPETQRYLDGKITITMTGTAFIDKLYPLCNSFNMYNEAEIILDGGTLGTYMGATDRPYDNGKASPRSMVNFGLSGCSGTYTVYITKNFKLADQDGLTGLASTAYNGIGGSTASKDYAGALKVDGLGDFLIKADKEVYEAVKADSIKVNYGTFDKIGLVDGDAEIVWTDLHPEGEEPEPPAQDTDNVGGGTTTEPAESDTAEETRELNRPTYNTKAETTEATPDTTAAAANDGGSMTTTIVIVAVCAVVAVAAIVVIIVVAKKKKA